MSVQIRAAEHGDISEVARLLSIIRMRTVSDDEIANLLNKIVSSDSADILLATKDDKPIGMAIVNCVWKLNRTECRLDDVVVDPEQRGEGAGTVLLEACNDWAWERDCYKIEFTSRTERTGPRQLYERLGYEKRDSFIYTKISPRTDYVKTKVI